eukprot:867788-Pelagomonas_calceolata.AAC.5
MTAGRHGSGDQPQADQPDSLAEAGTALYSAGSSIVEGRKSQEAKVACESRTMQRVHTEWAEQ